VFFVYVLRSRISGRFYKGSTSEPTQRLEQHQQGLVRSTKHDRPWDLVHLEHFPTRSAAMRREQYLKTGKGRDELRQLLARATKVE